ncbi:MAG: hypothetical protein HQM00_03980 [Magnetococcales bacterium]|nr:hypothetical protein [Magnetococcales bacterium]
MYPTSSSASFRIRAPLWVSAALLTVTIGAPNPVQAEPTLTAVAAVSSAAIIGSLLLSNADRPQTLNYGNGAVIYTSISPVPQTATASAGQPVGQNPSIQVVSAPVAYYAIPAPAVQLTTPYASVPQSAPASGGGNPADGRRF